MRDNTASDPLPESEVAPGAYLVVAANRDEFLAAFPGFSGILVAIDDGRIGGGLSNEADVLALLDPAGATVDAMSYGSDATAFDPACTDVPEGQSLSRSPAEGDTDASSDWSPGAPSPGGPWAPLPDPTATPTGTPTPTPSPSPTSGAPGSWPALLIAEVFYDPPQPGSDSPYEFVELYNPGSSTVALAGWRLGDNSAEDALPAVELPPGGYLVVAASRAEFLQNFPSFSGSLVALGGSIGGGLSNTGDRVKLIAPNGAVIDQVSYGSDTSAFTPSASSRPWADPSPASPATWTRMPRATGAARCSRIRARPVGSKTRRRPRRPRPPPPTSTPTATAPVASARVFLSEIFYDSIQTGSDADWEWIELFNPAPTSVTLSGWRIGDSTSEDALPDFTLGPGAYAVIAAREAAFRSNFPTFAGQLVALEGSIGGGLSNEGDAVRLIAPGGIVVDAMSYGSDKSAFDPSCRPVQPGESLVRWSEMDTDSAADWAADACP